MYFNKNYQSEKSSVILFSDIPAAVSLQFLWKTTGQKSNPLAFG
jgi:hypothetical protein